jgi:hypothetical protein
MPAISASVPTNSPRFDSPVPTWYEGEFSRLPNDAEFDRIFPDPIRESSQTHWTTVEVCRHAANWLVTGPETRVLDVGCGPGKFCAIGAASTRGHFTGVEQRRLLCRAARDMISHHKIPRVQILHANVTEVAFNCFDAFYIFNPFEENLIPFLKIDNDVPVRFELYDRYINYVRKELSGVRLGTRVVTFWGDCDEIPPCYDCVETAFGGELRLWIKRRVSPVVEISREEFPMPGECEFSIVWDSDEKPNHHTP